MCDNITIVEFLRLIKEKYSQREELEQYRNDAELGFFVWEKRLLMPYLNRGERFLVFGSGAGREVFALESFGIKAVGIELSPEQIGSAIQLRINKNSSGVFINAEALSLPFRDMSFDGILMFRQFIQHFPCRINREKLLAEAKRVLVPGGLLFLSLNLKSFSLGFFRIVNNLYGMMIKYRRQRTEDRTQERENRGQRIGAFLYKVGINLFGWFVFSIRNFYRSLMIFLLRKYYKGPEPGDYLISKVSDKESRGKIWFHDYSYSEIIKDLQRNGFKILTINDIFELESGINFHKFVRRGAKFISIVARKGI